MAEVKIPRPQSDFGIGECFEYLYQYVLRAHWIHINTNSHEIHKSMDFLFSELSEKVDTLLETIGGYARKEVKLTLKVDLDASEGACDKLINDLWAYSDRYEKIFSKLGYGDLENLIQEVKGIASKTRYLLTLK